METYYDVLGVQRDADPAAVRKAYLRASLRSHPDKNPGREAAAQAEFVRVGQAYSCISDPAKRAAYDRELAAAGRRGARRTREDAGRASTATTTFEFPADGASFQDFADLFDETVASMSETEVNMAMGVASAVGSVLGGIAGARTGKGGNAALSALGSAVGSAVASRAASTFVKSVHEDSTQRALERREREAAIKRGETVPEAPPRGRPFPNRGAAPGQAAHETSTAAGHEAGHDAGGERPPFPWREAVKLATMAVTACVEMQREAQSEAKAAGRRRK